MTDNPAAVIERIEAMLWQVLVLTDTIDAPLLGVKIDEAIQCAHEMRGPHPDKS